MLEEVNAPRKVLLLDDPQVLSRVIFFIHSPLLFAYNT